MEDAGDLATLGASAAGASIAWEGVKVPLWGDSVEVVEGFVVLGLVAKEALATATVLGQDLVAAMVVGPEVALVQALVVAVVEALVVALVALVEYLMAAWEVKAFPLAHRVASGK